MKKKTAYLLIILYMIYACVNAVMVAGIWVAAGNFLLVSSLAILIVWLLRGDNETTK